MGEEQQDAELSARSYICVTVAVVIALTWRIESYTQRYLDMSVSSL